MVKNFVLAAMIGLGIAGLVFILQQNTNIHETENELTRKSALEGNNVISDKPFVEKLGGESLLAKIENNLSNKNLTEEFTKGLADKIAGENPSGIQIQDGNKLLNVPDPNQIALDLLTEAQTKFNLLDLIPEIKSGNLKIISNSQETIIKYFKEYTEIINNANKPAPDLLSKELDKGDLEKITTIFNNTINSLYSLAVPKILIDFHKTQIRYLTAELEIFKKINNIERDPVAALIASENLQILENSLANETVDSYKKFWSNLTKND